MEPQTLLFETSPYGTLDAMVEQDERAAYLYLHAPQDPDFGTRAVWIQNLIKGPLVLSEQELQLGIPPLLPRTYSAHPDGLPELDPESLRFVWFEEGNGVALLRDDDILAVIPPWSGVEGFHGYSRECRTENAVCWPMPQQAHLETRIRRADQFWKQWQRNNPFAHYQRELIQRLEQQFSGPEQYYSIDGGKWPPRGIQSFALDSGVVCVSVGIGLCPMPNVELEMENPSRVRRIEIGFLAPADCENRLESALQWISGMASYPWRQFQWLGHGHTCRIPEGLIPGFAGGFFCHDRFRDRPLPLPDFHDDPVNLLWLVPIRQSEMQTLSDESPSDANQQRRAETQIDFVRQLRESGRLPA